MYSETVEKGIMKSHFADGVKKGWTTCIGFSLVLGCIYIQGFSAVAVPLPLGSYDHEFLSLCYMVSSVCHLIALAFISVFPRKACGVVALVSAALLNVFALLLPRMVVFGGEAVLSLPVLLVSAGLSGFSTAFVFVAWMARFVVSETERDSPVLFVTSFLLSFFLFAIAANLPFSFGLFVTLLLVPTSTMLLLGSARKAKDAGAAPIGAASPRRYVSDLWRFAIGIFLFGILFTLIKESAVGVNLENFICMEVGFYSSALLLAAFFLFQFVFKRALPFQKMMRIAIPIALTAFLFLVGTEGRASSEALTLMTAGYTCFESVYLLLIIRACKTRDVDPVRWIALSRMVEVAGIVVGSVISWLLVGEALVDFGNPGSWIALSYAVLLVASLIASEKTAGDQTKKERLEDRSKTDSGVETVSAKYGLTRREKEVLAYLAKGRSLPYIAEKLYISQGTVKTHVQHIYKKLEVRNRSDMLDLMEDPSFCSKNQSDS